MGNVKSKKHKTKRCLELEQIEDREDRSLIISPPFFEDGEAVNKCAPYPWNEIALWCLTTIPNIDRRLTDFSSVLEKINKALKDPEFLTYDVEDVFHGKFDLEGDFVTWGQVLLRENKLLANKRYQLVPRFIPENDFWRHFFSVVRHIIMSEVEPASA